MFQERYTPQDRAILQSYFPVMEGIATLIGDNCEIILHSLEDLNNSAIYIVNGHNTGRKIGAPLADFALKALHDIKKGGEFKPCIEYSKNKGEMRSVSLAILNSEKKIIGLLCINLNLNISIFNLIKHFLPPEIGLDKSSTDKHNDVSFARSVEELVLKSLEKTIIEVNKDQSVANNNKNREIVSRLYEKGIFDIKDAINEVAEKLNISRHTVYLYIRNIRKDEKDDSE